jgi:hypothetical protein
MSNKPISLIIHCTAGIPTTKPSPEADDSNELNCPAVQGQPMHIVSYISMKCREHPATGLSSLHDEETNFKTHRSTFIQRPNCPVNQKRCLFMSRQVRSPAHNRNVKRERCEECWTIKTNTYTSNLNIFTIVTILSRFFKNKFTNPWHCSGHSEPVIKDEDRR